MRLSDVDNESPTRDELIALVSELRIEIDRLREELRWLRRHDHEVPPHY